jgi:uncharacterized protein (DUF58 family)
MKRKAGGVKIRERIYIVPTWAGLIFATLIVLLFGTGYFVQGFGGPIQVLVIALVISGIVGLILTNDNLRGIDVLSCRAEPVPAGEPVVLEVVVANTSREERAGLRVRYRAGWSLRGGAEIPALAAGTLRTISISLPATLRGAHAVPQIVVSSCLPVGLCFAWKIFPEPWKYFVYPKGKSWRPVPMGSGTGSGGKEHGRDDVDGYRAYVPGDPPSRIDWRVFARTGRPVVRTFEGGARTATIFRWEDTDFLEDTENRLEQFSEWTTACMRAGTPFEAEFQGTIFSDKSVRPLRVALAAYGGEQ